MLRTTCMATFVCGAALAGVTPDVFRPYLDGTAPAIVEELPESTTDSVAIREFWFRSRTLPSSGAAYDIHCLLARPVAKATEKRPAVIVCHGGNGHLDMTRASAIGWAERGYVSITQDTPGFCNRKEATSKGPYFNTGGSMFTVSDPLAESPLCDGIIAVLNSLAILRVQPDVNTTRIGITGGSCGGYMTTVVAGLAGDRLRAAFSLYSGGFFDLASVWMPRVQDLSDAQRKWWLSTLDAGRHADNMKADYIVLAAANDWFFWPPSVEATLERISGYKNVLFAPNDYHQIRQPGGTVPPPAFDRGKNRTAMEIRFMEWKLKGEGAPFPTCQAEVAATRAGDRIQVRFHVTAERPIVDARVWWSPGEMPWRFRVWEDVEAVPGADGCYEALLPVTESNYPINWIGIVSDDGYATVSTRVRQVDPKALGIATATASPRLVAADFEPGRAASLWRWAAGSKRGQGGTFAIKPDAARTGTQGLYLHGPYSCALWGVRAAALKHAGTTGLRFWARSAGEPFAGLKAILVVEREAGARDFWLASKVAETTLTSEWRPFEVPWEAFEFTGRGTPRAPLLSDGLGELRFTLDGMDQAVYIDNVRTLKDE